MEKISEITTTETGEKEILIKVIEGVKSLELEIIEYEPTYIPEAKA